jgi:hypothetical protein
MSSLVSTASTKVTMQFQRGIRVKPRRRRKVEPEKSVPPKNTPAAPTDPNLMYWFDFVAQLSEANKKYILPFRVFSQIKDEKEAKTKAEWQNIFDKMLVTEFF